VHNFRRAKTTRPDDNYFNDPLLLGRAGECYKQLKVHTHTQTRISCENVFGAKKTTCKVFAPAAGGKKKSTPFAMLYKALLYTFNVALHTHRDNFCLPWDNLDFAKAARQTFKSNCAQGAGDYYLNFSLWL
jgi:hypothetical protein